MKAGGKLTQRANPVQIVVTGDTRGDFVAHPAKAGERLGGTKGIRGAKRSPLGGEVCRRQRAALELVIGGTHRERAVRVGQAIAKLGADLEVAGDFAAKAGIDIAAAVAGGRKTTGLAGVLDSNVSAAVAATRRLDEAELFVTKANLGIGGKRMPFSVPL